MYFSQEEYKTFLEDISEIVKAPCSEGSYIYNYFNINNLIIRKPLCTMLQ